MCVKKSQKIIGFAQNAKISADLFQLGNILDSHCKSENMDLVSSEDLS